VEKPSNPVYHSARRCSHAAFPIADRRGIDSERFGNISLEQVQVQALPFDLVADSERMRGKQLVGFPMWWKRMALP
jgi:hypothetical protein